MDDKNNSILAEHKIIGKSRTVLRKASKAYTIQPDSITHLKCGKTSYNANDIKNRYCGHCHEFLGN